MAPQGRGLSEYRELAALEQQAMEETGLISEYQELTELDGRAALRLSGVRIQMSIRDAHWVRWLIIERRRERA